MSRAVVRSAGAALLALAGCFRVPVALADDGQKAGNLTLIVENDIFYNTDRNYTNGVAAVWTPARGDEPAWLVRTAHWLPWFPEGGDVRHGYAIGQNMYAPHDIKLVDPPPDDRPYAGWLYGMAGMWVETGRQLDQFALTLGVVGPASMAEQTQKIVHRLIGSPEPMGWDTQLRNEPGVVLTYEHSWRPMDQSEQRGLRFDLTPHLGGALGNVYTYANGGLTLRAGRHLPLDYGPPRIQPSIPGSGAFVPSPGLAWYVFAGFDGRAVARNLFLDGNTFRSSRSTSRIPLVADLQWGFVLTWRELRVSYTHVLRTREFRSSSNGNKDDFGALTLSLAL